MKPIKYHTRGVKVAPGHPFQSLYDVTLYMRIVFFYRFIFLCICDDYRQSRISRLFAL